MAQLPKEVSQAWENREGPIVLATVDAEGMPNTIYASCAGKFDEGHLVVADNFFNKTRVNIEAGCKGSILFITEAGKSFQVKGTLDRQTSGAVYDDMKGWNPEKLPGHAAAVLTVEEVYSGGDKLL